MDNRFPAVPSVYQIEVTSSCHAQCPMCRREEMVSERGDARAQIDFSSLRDWVRDGLLDNTAYTELQMAGEPLMLLGPKLDAIISLVGSEGTLVGLSTNGHMLPRRINEVRRLDALTVSIDSIDPAEHEASRPGVKFENIVEGLSLLEEGRGCIKYLTACTVHERSATDEAIARRAFEIRQRFPVLDEVISVRDCRVGDADFIPFCTTPFNSVSIQCDGTVVSCCYAFGRPEPNTYGNLNDNSLAEIWASKNANRCRDNVIGQRWEGQCVKCPSRSPELLHHRLVRRLVKRMF